MGLIFKGMNDEPDEVEVPQSESQTSDESAETSGQPESEAADTQDPQELLRAMREDREKDTVKMKAIEQQNEFYKNIAMQNMQKSQQGQPPMTPQQQAAARFQNDDILTYGEMQEEFNSQLGSVQQQMQQMRGQMDEELTKTQHPDFADVIDQLVIPMIRANPRLMDEINQQPRPALYAYKLGCMTPEYIAYQQKTATEKVTNKIEKNLSKPKTLGNAGASNTRKADDSYANMTSEEFAKKRAELLGF